jgi:hypothetical protein
LVSLPAALVLEPEPEPEPELVQVQVLVLALALGEPALVWARPPAACRHRPHRRR